LKIGWGLAFGAEIEKRSESHARLTLEWGAAVSVAELLVLPVWGYVSTSGLYLMLLSEVG